MQKVAKESFMSWNRIEEIILDVKPLFDAASDAICIQNVEGEIKSLLRKDDQTRQ